MSYVTSPDAQPDTSSSRQKLAAAVRARRLELGYSVRAVAEQAGIARGTWIALEEGVRRTLETAYAGIERSLHWAPGSIRTILDGGNPTPVTDERMSVVVPTVAAALSLAEDLADDPVMRILNSSASPEVKQEIVKRLLAEQRQFAQRRVDELLREALADQAPPPAAG